MSSTHKLPLGLLIILHLHLLNFPLHDATGYNERLFDPSRGMRDRTKAMEDITYFLVVKIEGGKERVKSILPTYPCLQPADVTAYRIALSKYLESLRNSLVYTTHASDTKGKGRASAENEDAAAWWWKDVVVRKSILDECSGDRFERLILALSSHAILQSTSGVSSFHHLFTKDHESQEALSSLSKEYASRLAGTHNARLQWERSGTLLQQREIDLAMIRARITDPQMTGQLKYKSLTTDKLLALRDSRLQDLLRGRWEGNEGSTALRLITDFAGLVDTSASTDLEGALPGLETGALRTSLQGQSQATSEVPLPIAAAHHPAELHSLQQPLFPKANTLLPHEKHTISTAATTPHALSERVIAIEKVQASLHNALAQAQSLHAKLQRRLEKNRPSLPPSDKVKRNAVHLHLDVSLWNRRDGHSIDFKKLLDPSSLRDYGIDPPLAEDDIEDRIANIRTKLLPPFTADPCPASDSEPEPDTPMLQGSSRLPKPSTSRTHATTSSHQHGQQDPKKTARPARPAPAKQVRVSVPSRAATRIPSGPSKAAVRRLSRRASAAKARRSTMFGRDSDAAILRIVESVQDRSDSEDEDEAPRAAVDGEPSYSSHTPQPRTPARLQGTRGTLLSSTKKTGPRQSYDIEKFHRINVPRLPSLPLESAQELDEDTDVAYGAVAGADQEDIMYEGNSMTLADILIQAGHRSDGSDVQLLDDDELEDDTSDWE